MLAMTRGTPVGREGLAWVGVLLVAAAVLALLGYEARDSDSRLYAELAARMARSPVSSWIAPTFPPGWYMTGLFREHPIGIHLPPALLARLGYPSLQAAFLVNALYQMLGLVLLARLAATVLDGPESRALGWMMQLLPIAFTFRIRANHEQAVLLCLLVALYGIERTSRRGLWGLAVVAGIVGLLLVKGVLVLTGIAACGLWLLARRGQGPVARTRRGAIALLAAVLAAILTAWLYEQMYRQATGQAFWSVYLARQLGVAVEDRSAAGLAQKIYNLVWYAARVLWFSFPWSLTLGAALLSAKARKPAPPGPRSGVIFVLLLTAVYLGAFSLSDRRADRYLFPIYYAVGAAGALVSIRSRPGLHDLASRLDRPWIPPAVWLVTFGLHLLGGRLGLPTVKVWAPDT